MLTWISRILIVSFSLLTVGVSVADELKAVSRPTGDDIAKKLGVTPFLRDLPTLSHMTIAVLDSGFAGFDGQKAYLPKSAKLVEVYDPDFIRIHNLGEADFHKPLNADNVHGRAMAQIVWAATGQSPDGPRFLLLNANGPTMFRRAVRYAIDQRVHAILFAGHFEGAGNYDGAGPINAIVTEAVKAGILWINAAGNLRGQVYDGDVRTSHDGWLRFEHGSSKLRFRNLLDENTVTITLTWNDYQDIEDAGTTKDLDLFVEDSAGKVIGSSTLRQVIGPAGDGESRNPRERLVLDDLPASEQPYAIRIKEKAGTFVHSDRFRVLVSPAKSNPRPGSKPGTMDPGFTFVDARRGREIYPPADHPGVVTVGDPGSSYGPTADSRNKPDVYLGDTRIAFTNGDVTAGSSNAAAMFAGIALVLKATEPGLTAAHLKKLAVPARRSAYQTEYRSASDAKILQPNWRTPDWRELATAVRLNK